MPEGFPQNDNPVDAMKHGSDIGPHQPGSAEKPLAEISAMEMEHEAASSQECRPEQ